MDRTEFWLLQILIHGLSELGTVCWKRVSLRPASSIVFSDQLMTATSFQTFRTNTLKLFLISLLPFLPLRIPLAFPSKFTPNDRWGTHYCFNFILRLGDARTNPYSEKAAKPYSEKLEDANWKIIGYTDSSLACTFSFVLSCDKHIL